MKKKALIIAAAAAVLIAAAAIIAVAVFSPGKDKDAWREQYDLGERYLGEGNYREAVIAFTAAIEIDPRNPELYMARAGAYAALGETEAARADYRMALEYDWRLIDAWLALAETYVSEGDTEEALEILREGLRQTGDMRIEARIAQLEAEPAPDTPPDDTPDTPEHVHTWLDATCTEPRACSTCGETEGEPLGHDMQPATFDEPAFCLRCGYTEGEPLVDNTTWTVENGTLIIGGTGAMRDYDYGNFAPWFEHAEEIERIVIENGVTRIGTQAFSQCGNVAEITIPDSVTEIGYEIMDNYHITTVTVPNSVTTINESAFSFCHALQSIQVESGNPNYISVDGVLFSKDMKLLHTYPSGKSNTEYVIPSRVERIATDAFACSGNLIHVTIPDGVTTIGPVAFQACGGLIDMTIPASVRSIGEVAFFNLGSAAGITVDSNNPSYISVDGVLFSRDMTLLHTYPSGKQGTAYTVPDSVTTIEASAFGCCYSLVTVTIPESVTEIRDDAFFECTSLTDIYYAGTAERWGALAAEAGVPETAVVHFGAAG